MIKIKKVVDSYFVLAKGKKFLEAKDWLDGSASGKVLTENPMEAFTSMTISRLEYMLSEFNERLRGFIIREIEESSTTTFKVLNGKHSRSV